MKENNEKKKKNEDEMGLYEEKPNKKAFSKGTSF